jgi:hypothetical protein
MPQPLGLPGAKARPPGSLAGLKDELEGPLLDRALRVSLLGPSERPRHPRDPHRSVDVSNDRHTVCRKAVQNEHSGNVWTSDRTN